MAAKGTVQPNAPMTNQYELLFEGMPVLFAARVSGFDRQIVTTELADKTKQTTGQVNPFEFEVDHYPHHVTERVALEEWHRQVEGGGPLAKRSGLLFYKNAAGGIVFTKQIVGAQPKGQKTPDLNAKDDGSAVMTTWVFDADDVITI